MAVESCNMINKYFIHQERKAALKKSIVRGQITPFKKFIKKMWKFLTSNVGAFIIGFSGLIVAIYTFYINRPIIEYDTATHSFISSQNDNKFKVLVENKEYDDLYQSVVIMQNNGQQALAGSDVSRIGHDPIRIVVPHNAEMVHFTLDNTQTSPAVTANLKEYKGDIIISFDFLNPGEQIAVTILHKQPAQGFKIVGTALGVTSISHVLTERQILYIVASILIGLYILTIFLGILDRKGYL